jgi:hypothetical protein
MNLGTLFYIVIVSIIIVGVTIFIMKRRKRLPYTYDTKKKIALTQLDKMLTNIKYQEPQSVNQIIPTELHTKKIETETSDTIADKPKEKDHSKTVKKFDTQSAIVYSSIIQRKKLKH